MTKKILFLALTLTTSLMFANNLQKGIGKNDTTDFKRDSFFKKEFVEIGRVSNITVQVVHSMDIATKEKVSSVQIIYSVSLYNGKNFYDSPRVIDITSDDIDELVSAMQYINDKVFPIKPVSNSSYVYKSKRGNFSIGCFTPVNSFGDIGNLSDWRGYLRNTEYLTDGQDDYSQAHFISLLALLKQAKAKL